MDATNAESSPAATRDCSPKEWTVAEAIVPRFPSYRIETESTWILNGNAGQALIAIVRPGDQAAVVEALDLDQLESLAAAIGDLVADLRRDAAARSWSAAALQQAYDKLSQDRRP